jgi:hypothetical protein
MLNLQNSLYLSNLKTIMEKTSVLILTNTLYMIIESFNKPEQKLTN